MEVRPERATCRFRITRLVDEISTVPEGQGGNSPAFQRRVKYIIRSRVPAGTTEAAQSRPDSVVPPETHSRSRYGIPPVKVAGYFRPSLPAKGRMPIGRISPRPPPPTAFFSRP